MVRDPTEWQKLIVPAAIGAAAVIFAALIALLASNAPDKPPSGLSPARQPSAAVTTPASKSASIAPPTSSISTAPSQKPQPHPKVIHLLSPVSQSGWTIVWHGVLNIGLPGVVFSRVSSPQQGNGSQFDLQYQGAGDGTWVETCITGLSLPIQGLRHARRRIMRPIQ